MSGWFIGEVIWNYYELILHIKPFPSFADVFYLLAYPLIFFGLLNEVSIGAIHWKKINRAIFFLFTIASLCLAVLVFYFGVYVAYDVKESLLANIIAMGYGVGDLVLIVTNMFVLILVWEFRGGSLSRTWIVIFVSLLCMLLADILFALYPDQYQAQLWIYKNSLDSLWMLSYLLFAYALANFGLSILDAKKKIHQLGKAYKKK
jgi:hypothetical protein